MKTHNKKYFLRPIISSLEDYCSVSALAKYISVLDTIKQQALKNNFILQGELTTWYFFHRQPNCSWREGERKCAKQPFFSKDLKYSRNILEL